MAKKAARKRTSRAKSSARRTARGPAKRTPAGRSAKRAARTRTRKFVVRKRAAPKRTRTKAGPAAQKRTAKAVAPKRARAKAAPPTPKRARAKVAAPATPKRSRAKAGRQRGGTGREATLAQTPATGRSVLGPTNPWPTKRSTGTTSGAGDSRRIPGLERERKQLREVDETVQGPPSSLNMDSHASAARTGRAEMRQAKREHTQTGPAMTGGDVDADWGDAYAVGDEAPGGDNPTPDQDVVDEIGKSLGVEYQDNEELKSSDKIIERDRHRWELDPASSEDYKDRDKE